MAVFTKSLRKHIFIHPGDQHKIHSAVRTVLMKDRKKYSDRMGGALLDVSNIKMIGNHHLVVHGHLSMEVMADFQIFAPKIGMTLQGYINKVHKKYCGCVTMDFFNATLSYPKNFDAMPNEGDTCSFTVESLIVNGDMLHLTGQLISVDEREPLGSSLSQGESPKNLHKKTAKEDLQEINSEKYNGDTSELVDQTTFENDASLKVKHKKKLKKDRQEANGCDTTINLEDKPTEDSLLENKKSPKKKHKKKSKEETWDSTDCDETTNSQSGPTDNSISESKNRPKNKHKKKSKEEELEFNDCDKTIQSKVEESITDGDKSPKKKHKKKSKEKNLESDSPDKTMKSDVELTDLSILESNRSPKKEHKNKSKEYKYDCDTVVESEIKDISMTEDNKTPKKKHKKKLKEDSLDLESNSNRSDATLPSEFDDSKSSVTPHDKLKRKHKRKHRSEEEMASVSPDQKVKKLKMDCE